MNESSNVKQCKELELLAHELSDVKSVLRELSQQLLRIERRVRVALPPPARSALRPSRRKPLDEGAVHRTIERLKECAKSGQQIEGELRQMSVKGELAVLARALGMTNTKLPPKDDLVRRISTRLRQGATVASGIHGALQEDPERYSGNE